MVIIWFHETQTLFRIKHHVLWSVLDALYVHGQAALSSIGTALRVVNKKLSRIDNAVLW